MTVKTSWETIESWLEENAPSVKDNLGEGATDAEIAETEKTLGLSLPEAVKDSYRIHNGQPNEGEALFGEWQLLSLQDMVREWQRVKELVDSGAITNPTSKPDKGVKADWWNDKWIPVTWNFNGDLWCVDLDPDSDGKTGQIVNFWSSETERELLAESFGELLETLAADLKKGVYSYDDSYGLMKN
jgi:cell wall assembly regulator SMI1